MDIVTHAMMGVVAASPFLESKPVAACAFVVSSVLPDLDSLSRLGGKVAFLRHHQTTTHAVPAMLAVGALVSLLPSVAGSDPGVVGAAAALGMAFHVLWDVVATYGTAPFAPFTRRRVRLDWVFFLDPWISVATGGALLVVVAGWRRGEPSGSEVVIAWAAFLAAYLAVRIVFRRRARSLVPGRGVSLVPTSLRPWIFLGARMEDGRTITFRVDARRGVVTDEVEYEAVGEDRLAALRDLPEWKAMGELSEFYRVVRETVEDDGVRLHCRDLRTRNFGTSFGELEVVLGADRSVRDKLFRV